MDFPGFFKLLNVMAHNRKGFWSFMHFEKSQFGQKKSKFQGESIQKKYLIKAYNEIFLWIVWNEYFHQWYRSHCVSGMLHFKRLGCHRWWSTAMSRLYSKSWNGKVQAEWFYTSLLLTLICSLMKILQLNNIFICSAQVLVENMLL